MPGALGALVAVVAGAGPAAAYEPIVEKKSFTMNSYTTVNGDQDRAATSDANHFRYLVKANQLFVAGSADSPEEGLKVIEAPTLMLQAEGDLMFFAGLADQTQRMIESDGPPVQRAAIAGDRGHLNGVLNIQSQGEKIRAFLNDVGKGGQ